MERMGDWCLIESDPGVFTELVDSIGVKGVRFEEVYDLDLTPSSTYGLIFLFKCNADDKEPRQIVEHPPSGLFFAKQVIRNACATQAILSVLLNSKVKDLGKELTEFKSFTSAFDPHMKGLTISNQDTIRAVHNSFARQTSFDFAQDDKDEKEDAFHFIGYVPYKGKVYELDGLQDGAIEIGSVSGDDWLATVKPEIRRRMEKYQSADSSEIRFNVLSIQDDPAYPVEVEITKARFLRQRANIKLVSFGEELFLEDEVDDDEAPDGVLTFEELPDDVDQLKKLVTDAASKIEKLTREIADHLKRRSQWKRENARRRHDYVPFLLCALKLLANKKALTPAYAAGKQKAQAELEKKNAQKSPPPAAAAS